VLHNNCGEANKSLKFGDRSYVDMRLFTTWRISARMQKCLDPRKGIQQTEKFRKRRDLL